MNTKISSTNIVYKIDLIQLNAEINKERYREYKFKELGYMILLHKLVDEKQYKYHGFITIDELKSRIGDKQYNKFCQGKREFIIQKRINKKNI